MMQPSPRGGTHHKAEWMAALTKDDFATGETAKYPDVSVFTVRLWVRKSLILAERSPYVSTH